MQLSFVRRTLAGLACVLTSGCDGRAGATPAASFLVVAGDSTFWVESGRDGLTTRRSPIMLALLNGRFHELYVVDEDLSYSDALMVGQRVYRRDVESGDSTLVRYDTTIAGIAMTWSARHPDDEPLGPDEDVADDPLVHATTDMELIDVIGPFLSYEFHLDVDIHGERDQHVTQLGVVDLRDGSRVGLAQLASAAEASRVYAEGRARFSAALDSVRRNRDERATRARQAIEGFDFDSTSFQLLVSDKGPVVSFLVPGRGPRAGGYSLPLGEIPIEPGAWWRDASVSFPTRGTNSTVTWSDSSYDVVATVNPTGTGALLEIRHDGRSWPAASVALPVQRVFRLGTGESFAATRRALTRAFDEADSYSGLTNPASQLRRGSRHLPPNTATRTAWTPARHARANRSSPTS
ncbi:MAG: hypothetical protein H7066_00315 [Cytophagaceae bacterium]|nr:hypothetical protein [Gemmatimonadaceae bacterium]